jgi:hypothetical protein
MIFLKTNKERRLYKFIFTGRHIYCYIHAISETTNDLKIVDQIIVNYSDQAIQEEYKQQLSNHKNYTNLIAAIDNMMKGNPVEYTEQIEPGKLYGSGKLLWFNNLYLDQKSTNIMPPITIQDYHDNIEPINIIEENTTMF